MPFQQLRLLSLIPLSAMLIASSAQAAPITGQTNIAGSVDVSGTSINFNPAFINTSGAMETGSFAGLTQGVIKSLTGGPVVGATFVPGFAVFTTGLAAPVTFDLTFISPGVGTLANCGSAAPGSSCTPANSPFTLFQLTSNTVVATLQLNGRSYIGTAPSGSTPTTSVFSTATALQGTIPQFYQTLVSGGTLTGITFAAAFNATPVPEPSSIIVLGLGMVGIGLVKLRRSQKNG